MGGVTETRCTSLMTTILPQRSRQDPCAHGKSIIKTKIRVVSVAAEMHVCRRMSEETGGMFGVSTSQHHLEELLLGHAPPPPLNEEATKASLVHMGFPKKTSARTRCLLLW